MAEGDRNTRYYHTKTLCRRRRNRISMLKNSVGVWVDDEEGVVGLIQDYYTSLFWEKRANRGWLSTKQGWGVVRMNELENLGREVNGEEVKRAFFQMGAFKAPGGDGFPAAFYQHNWHTVGNLVTQFVKELWDDPTRIDKVNDTLLVLILKVD